MAKQGLDRQAAAKQAAAAPPYQRNAMPREWHPAAGGGAHTPDGDRGVAAKPSRLVSHLQPSLQEESRRKAGGKCRDPSTPWGTAKPAAATDIAATQHSSAAAVQYPSSTAVQQYLAQEGVIAWVHGARKHGFLPNQHPELITGVVKSICSRGVRGPPSGAEGSQASDSRHLPTAAYQGATAPRQARPPWK